MFRWFNQPYPFLYERLKTRLLIFVFVLVFVFFFLIIFKPFDFATLLTISLPLGAFYYALTSSTTVFAVSALLLYLFPNYFSDNQWKVGREIILMNVILIAVSIANGTLGYNLEICPPEVKPTLIGSILRDLKHSYAIGIFPVALLTGISYTIFLKRNLAQVNENNKQLESLKLLEDQTIVKEINPEIEIISATKNNDIQINVNNLLYIMADGNYVEFHLSDNNNVKREIRRNTLSHIESQLTAFDYLFRSHRAYIVNLKKVMHSSGNAQGYTLKLHETEVEIPVSRRNLEKFDALLKP